MENHSKILQAMDIVSDADKSQLLCKIAVLYPDAVLYAHNYEDVDAKIRYVFRNEGKIPAIKLCRSKKSQNLKDAVRYCKKLMGNEY